MSAMGYSNRARPMILFCLVCCLPHGIFVAADFAKCKENFDTKFKNTTPAKPNNPDVSDPIYRGTLHWFHEHHNGSGNFTRDSIPILGYRACENLCGKGAYLNDRRTIFEVLTTWVLPMLALFSNLPFESISKNKVRHTFEALVNWIGSPQSAFTTTMFNIYQIQECKNHVRQGPLRQNYMDSFFVLSCVNQYYYPRYSTMSGDKIEAKRLEDRRNRALFYGLFRPLSTHTSLEERSSLPADIEETRFLITNLANHLRMLRKRGVVPMTISLIWFFLSFIISLVLAFQSVGNSTTGHSLGLGLGLSWLPALVFMTIVDRNPISPIRCKALIERWLYNVEAIIEYNQAAKNTTSQSSIGWWNPEMEPLELIIGDFVGSGRRLRHCGVTNTVLDRLDHAPASFTRLWKYSDTFEAYEQIAADFEEDLVKRPRSWWMCWICGSTFVFVGISMSIMISFTTGTVGLGCRALLWMVFWFLSSVSWIFQAVFQEPPRVVRWISVGVNSFSFLVLLLIMIFQTTGGLNSCLCKSSLFAGGWGWYMDLITDAELRRKVYPHLIKTWGAAAGIGPFGALIAIFWTMRRWQRSSELWKADEQPLHLIDPLQRPEKGEDRQWRQGSDPVYWLT